MLRKIISIDEEKCTGCGKCIPDCPEGALRIIDGKARLVSDLFCDGLGACIGTCPEGAICVVEREAGGYDEKTVMETIAQQGEAVIRAHIEHLIGHRQAEFYRQAIEFLNDHKITVPRHQGPECHEGSGQPGHNPFMACPGSAARSIARDTHTGGTRTGENTGSELRQWPIQLQLLNPSAGYFENADLLVSADCIPFAYADFHRDFLKDKIVIMFCPKLDADIEGYITKLSEIFARHTLKSVTVLRMEVPCCGGVRFVVDKALAKSGKTIPVFEKTITIQGSIK
jgi:NAD-dependent dihydropyrimidine dehydrogenase PreA subunit